MKTIIPFMLLLCGIYCNTIAQHPWMLKDINATGTQNGPVGANTCSPGYNSLTNRCQTINGVVVFPANDGIHGEEMWRSDGTAAGTYMLTDITPGSAGTTIDNTYNAGNLVYFTIVDAINGVTGLWRTDGTTVGTFQIMNRSGHYFINYITYPPEASNYNALIGQNFFFKVTDTLSPIAYNGTNYLNVHDRIYKTDGTLAGTTVYYDAGVLKQSGFTPTVTGYGRIQSLGSSGNNIYITAVVNATPNDINSSGPSSYTQLLRGDGNSPATIIFSPTAGYPNVLYISQLANVNDNYCLFGGYVNGVQGLYRIYPSENSPVYIGDYAQGYGYLGLNTHGINPAIGNKYFFKSKNQKPAVTDGTTAGTFEMNASVTPEFCGSYQNKIVLTNGLSWDGVSPSSYSKISDSLTGMTLQRAFQYNNKLYFIPTSGGGPYIKTAELDGSNCLQVYPYLAIGVGTILNNGYFDIANSVAGSGFDAGYEPLLFKTDFKIFTGVTSSDWNDGSNWSPVGIPTAADNVVIPILAANKLPIITNAATCNNITLCNATLSITGANLDINGYVSNYLSAIIGTGSITFKSVKGSKIDGYPNAGGVFFDVANIYINSGDLSFGTPIVAFNSPVTFLTDNKILAPYNTSVTFNKAPFIQGYNANRFVVTNGKLWYNNAGSATTIDSIFTMPIGNSISSYTPISFISKNVSTFYVSVADSINQNGSTGSLITDKVVSKCWTISGGSTSNTKLSIGWALGSETPNFNHDNCYIAYNSGGLGNGTWIAGTNQPANIQNGIYSISQRYTSFPYSRFIVRSDLSYMPLAYASTVSTMNINGTTIYNDGTSIINTITPSGTSPVTGSITAKVTIDATVQSVNGQPYLQRHYDVEPATNASTATATITLYYTQAEFTAYNTAATAAGLPLLPIDATDAANNKANLRINQFHGTGTAPGNYSGYTGAGAATILITPTTVSYNSSAARWEVTFPVTGFSGFYASTSSNGILPVSLTTFTATLQNHQSILNWATATETNNKGFDVERSADAVTFAKIGYVTGHGTTTQQENYTYIDAQPLQGKNYYRLKQIDLDGHFTYSNIVEVSNVDGNNSLKVFPSPAKNSIAISTTGYSGMVQILDVAGHIVKTATITGNNTVLDISSLSKGNYFCKAGGATVLFVKE